MAGHYQNTIESASTGKPVSGATIYVYQDGATISADGKSVTLGTFATIYSDDAVTAIDQTNAPLTTGTDGEFDFYTDEGRVVIAVEFNGTGYAVWNDVDLVDGSTTNITAALQAALDAETAQAAAETAQAAVEAVASVISEPLVIVAAGQSNMDGAGDGGTMPAENPLVQMFDLTTRAFRTLSYTNRISRTNVNTGSPMTIPSAAGKNNLAFSAAHELHRLTGRPVYLIIVSNGGTHIGRWVGSGASDIAAYAGPWGTVGTAKPLYVEMKAAVEDALALIGVSTIDLFLWHQGETKRPGYTSPEDFATDFGTLRSQLAAETWWAATTQFIAGECVIGSYYQDAENYNDFYRALNDSGDPYTKCVSGEGLAMNAVVTNPDSVHYDGESLYQLGLRYARASLGDKAALARRADPATTVYGAKSLTYDWTTRLFGDAETIDPLDGRIVDQKRPTIARVGVGGFQAGQRVVNALSCAVTHNADGTFTVTPNGTIIRDWSFDLEDYWTEWPAVTKSQTANNELTITGRVDKAEEEKFRLWIEDDTSASIAVSLSPYLTETTLANEALTIDWGDGTVESGLTGNGAAHTHTYSPAFTGYVIVSAPKCCNVTFVQMADGKWRSPLSAFSELSKLATLNITSSDNKMFGSMRDLPQAITSVNFGGNNTIDWDFTGLPNLTNLIGQGVSTINPASGAAVPKLMKQIILDGADRVADQIDNLFIALANVQEWASPKTINTNYTGQAAPTSASLTARTDLAAKGVTVTTN